MIENPHPHGADHDLAHHPGQDDRHAGKHIHLGTAAQQQGAAQAADHAQRRADDHINKRSAQRLPHIRIAKQANIVAQPHKGFGVVAQRHVGKAEKNIVYRRVQRNAAD